MKDGGFFGSDKPKGNEEDKKVVIGDQKIRLIPSNPLWKIFGTICLAAFFGSLLIWGLTSGVYRLFARTTVIGLFEWLKQKGNSTLLTGCKITMLASLLIGSQIWWWGLRPPKFDRWVRDIAKKRLSCEYIFFTRHYLFIHYDVGLNRKDIKEFVQEISDKSEHFTYYLDNVDIDSYTVSIQIAKRQVIPKRAVLDKSKDTVWNFIPMGEAVNDKRKCVSVIGWYLNDNNINEEAVECLPSTSLVVAGGPLHVNTHVPTNEGVKTLENVKVDDFVLNKGGEWTKVLAISEIMKAEEQYTITVNRYGVSVTIVGDSVHYFPIYLDGIYTEEMLSTILSLYQSHHDIECVGLNGKAWPLVKIIKSVEIIPVKCISVEDKDHLFMITDLSGAMALSENMKVKGPFVRNGVLQKLWDDALLRDYCILTHNTGSGKSVVENGIIGHISRHSDNIQGFLADVKQVEFSNLDRFKGIHKVAITVAEVEELLSQVRKIMMDRFGFMKDHGVNNVYKLKADVDWFEIDTPYGKRKYQFDEIFKCSVDGKDELISIGQAFEYIEQGKTVEIDDMYLEG